MSEQNQLLHRKTGAEQIKSFCAMHLFSLGINLKFIDWSTNVLGDEDEHILKLNIGSRDIELKFHVNELIKYARLRDVKKTEIKIKRGLKDIVSE
tara:strand:+ start:683 stop:967 length:285 start_codon:yes stop_codon:yes gene_type:complete